MSENNKCEACKAWEAETGYGKICHHSTTPSSEDEVVQGIVAHILGTQNWEADTTFLYEAIHSLLSRQREEMVALGNELLTIFEGVELGDNDKVYINAVKDYQSLLAKK